MSPAVFVTWVLAVAFSFLIFGTLFAGAYVCWKDIK